VFSHVQPRAGRAVTTLRPEQFDRTIQALLSFGKSVWLRGVLAANESTPPERRTATCTQVIISGVSGQQPGVHALGEGGSAKIDLSRANTTQCDRPGLE
jgi:hypothetical protein